MPEQKGYEEAVISAINSQMDAMINGVAGTMGLPPGAKRYTRQEQIDEWNYSPIADAQERMNKALELHMLGKTPEEITDELYPNVRRLIQTGRTRPDEQIAFAREMRKTAGWPDEVLPLDDTGLPLEMQVGMAQPQQQQPMMQPAPAPMPAPAPPPAPMPMPASPSMQQQPPPMGANPLMGLGG